MIRRELQGRADELVVKAIREIYDHLDTLKGTIDKVQVDIKPKPQPPVQQDELLTKGLNVALNAPVGISSGNGSPENVVVGRIGDMYLRQDGGAGTVFYIKESGAGTRTGWIAK